VESLISVYKKLFRFIYKKDTKLTTIQLVNLAEVTANSVNERPIALPASTQSDPREVLFLTPNSLNVLRSPRATIDISQFQSMTDKYREAKKQVQVFKRLHSIYYLKALRSMAGRLHATPPLQVNDVCLLSDKLQANGLPSLALVVKVTELDAEVEYLTKLGRRVTVTRAIEQLQPLVRPQPGQEADVDPYYSGNVALPQTLTVEEDDDIDPHPRRPRDLNPGLDGGDAYLLPKQPDPDARAAQYPPPPHPNYQREEEVIAGGGCNPKAKRMTNSWVYDEFLHCPELTPEQQLLSHSDHPPIPSTSSPSLPHQEEKKRKKRKGRKKH
jgi:hypothetical protein